jgi:GDPmannose 4,6-dehydratase
LGIGGILRGETSKLYLGNLKAKRDWGHAKDFVKGMYLMLNYKQPEDFVLATGETHSVEEFCRVAFEYAGLGDYSKYIEIDPKFYRPAEVDILLGDASKAKGLLGWNPEISFTDLVKMMVEGDK